MIEFTVIQKNISGTLVFWSILSFKNWSFSKLLSFFCASVSLVIGTSERIERKFKTENSSLDFYMNSFLCCKNMIFHHKHQATGKFFNTLHLGVYRRSIFKIRPNILIGLQKLQLRPKDRSRLFIYLFIYLNLLRWFSFVLPYKYHTTKQQATLVSSKMISLHNQDIIT